MQNPVTRVVRKCRAILGRNSSAPLIDISDDYVNWLCFANAGMLHRGNLFSFDYAIRNLPTQSPIVEVGSFCGLSTNLLTYYKRKLGAKNLLITSDRWDFEGAVEDRMISNSSVSFNDYKTFVKDSYIRNIRMFSHDDLPYTIEKLSDEFFTAWRAAEEVIDVLGRPIKLGGPISFCYIDGNHSYDYARRDFENADEFLERGGFILFDDSADGSEWEVCRVVAEIQQSNKYELVVKNPNYLFMKK